MSNTPSAHDITLLGQVFTPQAVVRCMQSLMRNQGNVLEPACGDGAFLQHLANVTAIEIDPRHAPAGSRVMNFFELEATERFDTIIGNPPYVRHQDIAPETRLLTRHSGLDGRANLYLFFIEKCLQHLKSGGELIFITPRDFIKSTSAVPLNREIFATGTITEFIDLGDARIFNGATPNCAIWRFERDNFSRTTRYAKLGTAQSVEKLGDLNWDTRRFIEHSGHLLFTREHYPLQLSDLAFVKVGAVSGADDVYANVAFGNRDFVCSSTVADQKTRRMIWCEPGQATPASLIAHKQKLITRRIRKFDDSNWWQWGRGYYQSDLPRIYVNNKTRRTAPFFVHDCPHYDGSVLAIFPRNPHADIQRMAALLNALDWEELGFVCDGRFLFTQRSLEQAPLPESFRTFIPQGGVTSCDRHTKLL